MSSHPVVFGLVVALAMASLALQECLLGAAAALGAYRCYALQLRGAPPADAWRVGVRWLFAGLAGSATAIAMAALLFAAAVGWWLPSHANPWLTIVLLALAGLVIAGAQIGWARCLAEAWSWLFLVTLATIALAADRAVSSQWTCLLSGAVLGYVIGAWLLLAAAGVALLKQG